MWHKEVKCLLTPLVYCISWYKRYMLCLSTIKISCSWYGIYYIYSIIYPSSINIPTRPKKNCLLYLIKHTLYTVHTQGRIQELD